MTLNNDYRKILFLSAAFLAGTACFPDLHAGEISRKTDFLLNVNQATCGNQHNGTGISGKTNWSYFLVPEYFQFFENDTNLIKHDKLLVESNLKPLQSNGSLIFQALERNQDNLLLREFRVTAESLYVSWKSYPGTPKESISSGALVMKCRVPLDGIYSLRGNLDYLAEKPAIGAIFAVGIQDKSSFRLLMTHTFGKESPAGEAKLLKVMDEEQALQKMKLSAGDQIVFLVGSARQGNLPLSVIDENLQIVSDVVPPTVEVSDTARVLSLLDLNRPELAAVKSALDAAKVDEAFNLYKAILAERAKTLPPVDSFTFWLFSSAKASELLDGVLTTGHYGMGGTTTYTIGKPGAVDWFKIPEDGYEVAVRDISTMQWNSKLAEAYSKTGEKRYLDAYLGYWCDFADNWPTGFGIKMRDPKFRSLVNNTVSWSANSRLYYAWRLETLGAGLCSMLQRAKTDNALSEIDNARLAKVLKHLYFWETPAAMRFLHAGGGAPNQQLQLAGDMFLFSIFLNDMQGAEPWRSASLDNLLNGSGYLADGTDMEQSFNYNKGLPGALSHYISLAETLPASQRGDWFAAMEQCIRYRLYFMHGIVMPMGGQPICGANNSWGEYEKPLKLMPGITDKDIIGKNGKYPLSEVIKERFYGEGKMAEPGFRSLYFPYGGYYALRSDWSPEALYSFMKVSRPGRGHMREGNNALTFCAFGRQLLINSGSDNYNPKTMIKEYGYSSISQNSIAVDGYGQKLNLEANPPLAYESPLNYRFLDGKEFSFAEGVYDRAYGGWNFMDTKLTDQSVIRDVRHKRQLLLLRNEKIWIVTDVLQSEQEHRFTQTWNFPPDFKDEEITAKAGVISTRRPDNVNLALYQFIDAQLDYTKYHGFKNDGRTLGWVAKEDKESGLDATAATDLHCSWSAKGEKVLITVVVPFKADNPVKSIRPLKLGKAEGVELTLNDGRLVEYYYGTEKAEAVLKTPEAALTLLPGGGYEEALNSSERLPIIIPSGFRWRMDGKSEKPEYSASALAPVTATIDQWIAKGYYPGAGLLVVRNGKPLLERYWGGYDQDTVVYIASAGKWLAAATVAAVCDEGTLSWDDPVSKWLPEFKDVKGQARLRQLFSHTSGFPSYHKAPEKADAYQSLAEAVAHIAPLPPAAAPGEQFEYGGLAMQVGGRMAEVATGKNFEELFQEKIARPLGMTNTHFTPVDSGHGHNPMLGGGARSSLHDYSRFLAMIANGGTYDGKRVLSETAVKQMQADQIGKAKVSFPTFPSQTYGTKHTGVYGLGEWRELEDANGNALLLSSPSWAGTYPWIDKKNALYGIFIAHVDMNSNAVAKDKFQAMFESAKLPALASEMSRGMAATSMAGETPRVASAALPAN